MLRPSVLALRSKVITVQHSIPVVQSSVYRLPARTYIYMYARLTYAYVLWHVPAACTQWCIYTRAYQGTGPG